MPINLFSTARAAKAPVSVKEYGPCLGPLGAGVIAHHVEQLFVWYRDPSRSGI